jgi:drug/metabolite transporter (DMT)-like permease
MPDTNASVMWLVYTLTTVITWGLYGLLLHTGQMGMGDPVHGRTKAFLFVGIAYFLTAVLAPLALLWFGGAEWSFPSKGLTWSLIAGILGAIGALCVLLAFGAKGNPVTVMTIVFAGAPIVNAITALAMHPPENGWSGIRWEFLLGIVLAVVGGTMVSYFKPQPSKPVPALSAAAPIPGATAASTPVAPAKE